MPCNVYSYLQTRFRDKVSDVERKQLTYEASEHVYEAFALLVQEVKTKVYVGVDSLQRERG